MNAQLPTSTCRPSQGRPGGSDRVGVGGMLFVSLGDRFGTPARMPTSTSDFSASPTHLLTPASSLHAVPLSTVGWAGCSARVALIARPCQHGRASGLDAHVLSTSQPRRGFIKVCSTTSRRPTAPHTPSEATVAVGFLVGALPQSRHPHLPYLKSPPLSGAEASRASEERLRFSSYRTLFTEVLWAARDRRRGDRVDRRDRPVVDRESPSISVVVPHLLLAQSPGATPRRGRMKRKGRVSTSNPHHARGFRCGCSRA